MKRFSFSAAAQRSDLREALAQVVLGVAFLGETQLLSGLSGNRPETHRVAGLELVHKFWGGSQAKQWETQHLRGSMRPIHAFTRQRGPPEVVCNNRATRAQDKPGRPRPRRFIKFRVPTCIFAVLSMSQTGGNGTTTHLFGLVLKGAPLPLQVRGIEGASRFPQKRAPIACTKGESCMNPSGLGPPIERLEGGYPLFSVVYFSRGTLPQKRVKGHYWGPSHV